MTRALELKFVSYVLNFEVVLFGLIEMIVGFRVFILTLSVYLENIVI